jgi:hypothetical protein
VEVEGNAAEGGSMSHGFNITQPNVEVSNLTVFHYRNTGVFWVGTSGYTSRYVTAYNNGVYGLYAFDTAGPGLFEQSYGSGHPDAAFYIGECNPCDATITDVVAENNGLGYSGTNASGNIVIKDSLWVNNSGGIVPNTLDSEELPPQCCIVIRNNTVIGSGTNPDAPTNGATAAATGFGISSAGGMYNLIEDNRVFDSSRYGIVVFPFPHETPNVYRAAGNIVRNNEVEGSGVFDLSLAFGSGDWNCFSGNSFDTSDPPQIETLYPCTIQGSALRNLPVSGGAVSTVELVSGLARFQPNPNYLEQPAPTRDHPTMGDPLQGF